MPAIASLRNSKRDSPELWLKEKEDMGALCGKEDHFQDLGSGNVLSAPPPKTKSQSAKSSPGSTNNRPSGQGQGKGQVLGGGSNSGPPPGGAENERREALLRAAEERQAAATKRGAPTSGKLSTQLREQKKDGGRAEEARREAESKGDRLVWD